MNYETKVAPWRFAEGWNGESRMGELKKKVHAEARRRGGEEAWKGNFTDATMNRRIQGLLTTTPLPSEGRGRIIRRRSAMLCDPIKFTVFADGF
jgi:hypothetical protein